MIDGLLSVLAVGGSLVYVANPDPAALAAPDETEKVTRTPGLNRSTRNPC